MNELLAEIHQAYELIDPAPPRLYEAARAAFAFRNPDAALADLVSDTTLTAAGVRGAPRVLVFEGPDITIDLEVSAHGPTRTLVGRLNPPQPASLRIHHRTGDTATDLGSTGHFNATSIPPGLAMLEFRLPDGSAIVTNWTRL